MADGQVSGHVVAQCRPGDTQTLRFGDRDALPVLPLNAMRTSQRLSRKVCQGAVEHCGRRTAAAASSTPTCRRRREAGSVTMGLCPIPRSTLTEVMKTSERRALRQGLKGKGAIAGTGVEARGGQHHRSGLPILRRDSTRREGVLFDLQW